MFGERVHHRGADAVESARDLVGIVVKLTAGVERGHDGLKRRDLRLRIDADGDAVAVICDAHVAVGEERDLYFIASIRHRLVARVVKGLPDEMVETVGTGRPDIHARALPHRFKTLKDGNGRGIVCFRRAPPPALFVVFSSCFSHVLYAFIVAQNKLKISPSKLSTEYNISEDYHF